MCDSFLEPLLIPVIGQSPPSAMAFIAHFIISKGFYFCLLTFVFISSVTLVKALVVTSKFAFNVQNDTLPLFPYDRPSAKSCILLVNINQRGCRIQ